MRKILCTAIAGVCATALVAGPAAAALPQDVVAPITEAQVRAELPADEQVRWDALTSHERAQSIDILNDPEFAVPGSE